jgi:hypothetical protein
MALDHPVIYPADVSCFTATTEMLHAISRYEPAIAVQDQYRRRPIGISSRLAPQSHNGTRLQSGHHAIGL